MAQFIRPEAADLSTVVVRKEQIEKCRTRAKQCRSNAETAQTEFDQSAWLDLAADWMRLAEALEEEDRPKWTN